MGCVCTRMGVAMGEVKWGGDGWWLMVGDCRWWWCGDGDIPRPFFHD